MQRIYFDHNATSYLDKDVKEYMVEHMGKPLNPSSIHLEGRKARDILEETRNLIKTELNIHNSHDLIFTSSCTEANNTILKNFNNKICTKIEHPSVKTLSNDCVEVNKDGIVCLSKLKNLMNPSINLISIMYANNEFGTIQPIDHVVKIVKEFECLVHSDITQAIGRIDINHTKDLDLLSFSVHKIGGPMGVGCLAYKKHINLKPFLYGGKQEFGLRAGTQNMLSIIGLKKLFENINVIKKKNKALQKLRDYLEKNILLVSNQKAEIIGKDVLRLPNTTSICMPNTTSEVQVIYFDLNGIAISAGAACSSGTVKTGIYPVKDNCIRISLGPKNNYEELDIFINFWKNLYNSNNTD